MKKNEFVSLVAERTDMSKKDTEKVIDAAFAAIGDLMMQGDQARAERLRLVRDQGARGAQRTQSAHRAR